MNNKSLYIVLICLMFFLIGCKDETLEIEEKNSYSWQKYMNEEEFNQLEKGMTYMDVVRIAGGAGKEIETGIYEWSDELLLTRGYLIQFKKDALIKTEIIQRKGNSTR